MVEDQRVLIETAYQASCRVQAKKAVGSCTIIYSSNGDTFALTNHHVVADNLTYPDIWDTLLQKTVKREVKEVVEVMFPRLDKDRILGYSTVLADIVIYDAKQDLALLKFRDPNNFPSIIWYSREKVKTVPILSRLSCIGAALGVHPICTFGNLNGVQAEIDNYEYWLSSAPSIYGNSGGGVFIEENGNWMFLGVPSRISVIPLGFAAQAVTHMGYFIPLFRIYDWLEEQCYQFLFDSTFDKGSCDKLREEKRQTELLRLIHKEVK